MNDKAGKVLVSAAKSSGYFYTDAIYFNNPARR
jgi:hypothetical protein